MSNVPRRVSAAFLTLALALGLAAPCLCAQAAPTPGTGHCQQDEGPRFKPGCCCATGENDVDLTSLAPEVFAPPPAAAIRPLALPSATQVSRVAAFPPSPPSRFTILRV